MGTESAVARHYSPGGLQDKVVAAATQGEKQRSELTTQDLAPVDEFHLGGIESTRELAAGMELRPGLRLLDIGCGIGGPARVFAAEYGCDITGIDLTEEFVQTAKGLTQLLGIDDALRFQQASALALPFDSGTFDRVYMIHVGMNISNKSAVFHEARRVVKAEGLFAIFDILKGSDERMRFPMPWALSAETSFVAPPEIYRTGLRQAGFRIERERSRRDFAIDFMNRAKARAAAGTAPVAGIHLLMGDIAPTMVANLFEMLNEGVLDPVEFLARAV